MTIERNDCFRYHDPVEEEFKDGRIAFICNYLGEIRLPQDYAEFMKTSNGVKGFDCDACFIAHFPDGISIFEFDYIANWLSMKRTNSTHLATSSIVTKVNYPDGFAYIGRAMSDEVGEGLILTGIDQNSPDYGKIYMLMSAADPYGEGDNTRGIGYVADSFTEFMNNFRPREEL